MAHITRKSNKRKRNEVENNQEISDKDKYIEMNILYNLYGFLSEIIRDNNMSVISFKRFLDEDYTLIAYNCLRYDWVVIDYIISTVLKKKSLTQGLFNSLVYIKSRETLNSHTKIMIVLLYLALDLLE